jgi:hypothetical protein
MDLRSLPRPSREGRGSWPLVVRARGADVAVIGSGLLEEARGRGSDVVLRSQYHWVALEPGTMCGTPVGSAIQ